MTASTRPTLAKRTSIVIRKRSRASDASRIAAIDRISEMARSGSISVTMRRSAGARAFGSPVVRANNHIPEDASCAKGI